MKKLKDAIEALTGTKPDEISQSCGSTWFKTEGKWYFITIEEHEKKLKDIDWEIHSFSNPPKSDMN